MSSLKFSTTIETINVLEQARVVHDIKGALYSFYKVIIKRSVNGHLLLMQFSTCKLGIHGNKHAHIAIIHPLT